WRSVFTNASMVESIRRTVACTSSPLAIIFCILSPHSIRLSGQYRPAHPVTLNVLYPPNPQQYRNPVSPRCFLPRNQPDQDPDPVHQSCPRCVSTAAPPQYYAAANSPENSSLTTPFPTCATSHHTPCRYSHAH